MGFLSSSETYERVYDDPDGADEKLTVTLRPLDAGDRAAIEDTIALDFAEETEDARPSIKVGTMKLLTVQRAVVSWSLPVAATAETVRRLHPKVLDAVFADVQYGSVPGETPDPLADSSSDAVS